VLPNWQDKIDTGTEDFNFWDERYAAATNTGVLTGPMPALDIDIKDPDAAVAIEETVKDWVGDSSSEVLVRFGNPPKRAIPFRTNKPFSKIVRAFQDAHGVTHRLEFLGEGQQVVVHGTHPDTGKPYSWHGNRGPDTVARELLPPIDEAEAHRLIGHCADILVQQFGFTEVAAVSANGGAHVGSERGPVDAEAELAAMTPDNVNDVHIRAIPSLLWRAINPNDVVTQVAAATMAMAQRHGLKEWCGETEARDYVTPRVKSALKNLFMEKYDPASGEIPPWLCPEWHEEWVAALAHGKAPNIGYNGKFFVRAYDRNGKVNGHDDVPTEAPPLVPEGGPRRRFPLIGFNELIPGDDPPFLVEDFLPRRGIALVWGKFKTLKSTFVLDLMLHVERGWKYRGLAVERGTIIYAVFEGSHGYRTRVEALRRHYEISRSESVKLFVMPASLNLRRDKATLVQDLKAQLGSDRPIAIVLDTLNRSLDGSESNDEDMQRYIKAADHLRDIFDALVLVIHHCGHNEDRPRGHSSLSGAIDCQIKIERQGDSMTAEVELMRDGPEGKQIHSVLKQLGVHVAANGKVVTAPVVVPAEEGHRAPKSMGKGTAAEKFFQAIREATVQHGEEFQPDIGALPVRAVEEGRIKHRFCEIYVPERAEDDPTRRADAIRSSFNQIYKKARSKGIVDTRAPHGSGKTMVWLPPRD
jgi:hypothetical protein